MADDKEHGFFDRFSAMLEVQASDGEFKSAAEVFRDRRWRKEAEQASAQLRQELDQAAQRRTLYAEKLAQLDREEIEGERSADEIMKERMRVVKLLETFNSKEYIPRVQAILTDRMQSPNPYVRTEAQQLFGEVLNRMQQKAEVSAKIASITHERMQAEAIQKQAEAAETTAQASVQRAETDEQRLGIERGELQTRREQLEFDREQAEIMNKIQRDLTKTQVAALRSEVIQHAATFMSAAVSSGATTEDAATMTSEAFGLNDFGVDPKALLDRYAGISGRQGRGRSSMTLSQGRPRRTGTRGRPRSSAERRAWPGRRSCGWQKSDSSTRRISKRVR